MAGVIQVNGRLLTRLDTLSNWQSSDFNNGNAKLLLGELIAVINNDTSSQEGVIRLKIGDGISNFDDLPYLDASIWEALNTELTSSDIQSMLGYVKPLTTSAISETDTLNEAIGKLEKAIENGGGDYPPESGIPKTDLASDVQISLGKADTALQTHQDISGKVDKTTTINGKVLSSNITLSASDVGALADTTTHLSGDIAITEKGSNNGVATLGSDGKIPSSQLPSYVDDVLEYDSKASFPEVGESGKIYVDKSTNRTWRWSGTTYVEISPSLALGETSSTAYAGDKGKAVTDALVTHKADTVVHITSVERATWDAKQDELSITQLAAVNSGITKAIVDSIPSEYAPVDAEKNVQSDWNVTDTTSDAYIKNKPTIPDEVTESTVASWGFTKNTGTYSKPTDGIPKTDLASAVQDSLEKADNSVQQIEGKGLSTNDYTDEDKEDLGNMKTLVGVKNIMQLPYEDTYSAIRGGGSVEFIVRQDGSVSVYSENITANANFYFTSWDGTKVIPLDSTKKYTLSGITGGSATYNKSYRFVYKLYKNGQQQGGSRALGDGSAIIEDCDGLELCVVVYPAMGSIDTILYPMLEIGEVAHDYVSPLPPKDTTKQVTFVALGHTISGVYQAESGDCTLIQLNGTNMLVDIGNDGDYDIIDNLLQSRNIDCIHYVIFSHMHKDHRAGIFSPDETHNTLRYLINHYDVRNIIMPVSPVWDDYDETTGVGIVSGHQYDSSGNLVEYKPNFASCYTTIKSLASSNGITVIEPKENEIRYIANGKFRFFNTDLDVYKNYYTECEYSYDIVSGVTPTSSNHCNDYTRDNNFSLCFELDIDNVVFYFTGDIEKKAQEVLIDKFTPCNVLKAPHHFYNPMEYPDFYKKTVTDIVVCMSSNPNGYLQGANLSSAYGNALYRTPANGNVTVSMVDGAYRVDIDRDTNKIKTSTVKSSRELIGSNTPDTLTFEQFCRQIEVGYQYALFNVVSSDYYCPDIFKSSNDKHFINVYRTTSRTWVGYATTNKQGTLTGDEGFYQLIATLSNNDVFSYEFIFHPPITDTYSATSSSGMSGIAVASAISTAIPTSLADLSDDATHRLVTDTEKATWNNKQDTISSATDLVVGTLDAQDGVVKNTTGGLDIVGKLDDNEVSGLHIGTNSTDKVVLDSSQSLRIEAQDELQLSGNGNIYLDSYTTCRAHFDIDIADAYFEVDSTNGIKLEGRNGKIATYNNKEIATVDMIPDAPPIYYGVCSTARTVADKVVSIDGITSLTTGLFITVKFVEQNSIANPTLNLNGLGAIAIKRYGTTAPGTSTATSWYAGQTVTLTYDGTYWQMHGQIDTDTKVTQAYSTANDVYPLLMTATAGTTSTSSRGATTSIVNNSIYANPSTGDLHMSKLNGKDVATNNVVTSNELGTQVTYTLVGNTLNITTL